MTDLTSWSDDQKPARIREHHQDPISTDLGEHATSLITVILVDVVADIYLLDYGPLDDRSYPPISGLDNQ
jgi:hypothetical protein